ncbi:MAG: Ppx/GppA phosphatase family protein [Solirubrobacteraceae bacterium]
MRSACIDIGSNTTRLLVGELREGELREVLAQRVFLRLRGELTAEQVAQVAAIAGAQAAAARAAGAADVTIVGTAAVRACPNAPDLCAAVEDAAGAPVGVLSGEDEARFAFVGATSTLAAALPGLLCVVDVGGGSTEIVCGTVTDGVTWAVSRAAGSGTLTDEHVHQDPPGPEELAALKEAARTALADLEPPRAIAAFAVGGSATSLRRLVGPSLDRDGVAQAVDALCCEPVAEVARRFDLHLERARVLPAGMLLLDAASELIGLPLSIAGGGLREGVVLERLRARS